MKTCNQCMHWDEDSMDNDGRARCEVPRTAPEVSKLIHIYVRGDYSCAHFQPKLVTSK